MEDSSLAAAVAAATESFINNIATTKDEETAAATAEKLSQETNTSEQQLVDEEQKMIAEQMEQEEKKDAPQEAEPAATTATTATTSKPQQQKQKPKTNKLRKKDTKWMATYNELLEYRAKHGDCMIPRGWPLNPRLASWVAEQRKQYKLRTENRGTSITAERIALLDQIGFAWNAQQASWAGHLADLTAFRKKHGHCHVPMQDPDYPKLGLWVKEQRRHYTLRQQNKKTHMTPERIAALDAIDFCWDTHHATWMERLKELSEFKRDVGHTSVPTNYARNSKLATWGECVVCCCVLFLYCILFIVLSVVQIYFWWSPCVCFLLSFQSHLSVSNFNSYFHIYIWFSCSMVQSTTSAGSTRNSKRASRPTLRRTESIS